MNKALITGGAGFIGSHLAEHLLANGNEVFILDNLSTGSLANLSAFTPHERLHMHIGEVTNRALLYPLIDKVDCIYHLAASVGVKNIMDNPISSVTNNIDSTIAVLEAGSKAGKKVLLTSTSEVYGKGGLAPSTAMDDLRMGDTTKSRWSYACSKALDEYLAFAYAYERDAAVTVVRLFNTVGDRQTDAYGMVIPTFIKQALQGIPITIFGDGTQSRCFAYVKDVVWALHKLMEHPSSINNIYNIGSTEKVTMNELADAIIAATNSQSQKIHIPYQQAFKKGFEDAASRYPDISKIQNLIGFVPHHSLADIIAITTSHIAHISAKEPAV